MQPKQLPGWILQLKNSFLSAAAYLVVILHSTKGKEREELCKAFVPYQKDVGACRDVRVQAAL